MVGIEEDLWVIVIFLVSKFKVVWYCILVGEVIFVKLIRGCFIILLGIMFSLWML